MVQIADADVLDLPPARRKGRIPGTDRWKPINENPEAQEDVPGGALIIRIRENLDFGAYVVVPALWWLIVCLASNTANTAQLKGECAVDLRGGRGRNTNNNLRLRTPPQIGAVRRRKEPSVGRAAPAAGLRARVPHGRRRVVRCIVSPR